MTRRLQRSLQLLAVAAIATTANGAAAEQRPVTWLVFVDDLHLDFPNSGRLRYVVQEVVKQLPADGEVMAMFSSLPSGVSIAPTTDRALLRAEAKKLVGSGLPLSDALANEAEGQRRSALAVSRLVELVGKVSGDTGAPSSRSRVAIIYVSNGYVTGTPPPLKMELSPPIFALDPRLLRDPGDPVRADWQDYWIKTRNSLREMAAASGGFVQEENESVDQVIARIGLTMRR